MKFASKFLLFFGTMIACCSMKAAGYSFLKPVMVGEGECIDDEWELHPIGSTWYDYENCEKLQCVFHKKVLYTKGYGCSSMGIPSGCELVPGKGAQYPSCCPQVLCPKGLTW